MNPTIARKADHKTVRFCWDCGKKLRGKYAYQMEHEGHLRTFHKSCAEYLEAEIEKEKWKKWGSGE